jgi:hypothetical protein
MLSARQRRHKPPSTNTRLISKPNKLFALQIVGYNKIITNFALTVHRAAN